MESSTGLVAHIKTHELFKDLPPSILADLETELELIPLAKGEKLCEQGDVGDSMYILLHGSLGVVIRTPDDRDIVVDDLKPGTSVGEMALLTGQARVATVHAKQDAELIKLTKTGFSQLADKHPQLMAKFAQTIVPRLQRTQLADIISRLFGEMETEELHSLQKKLEWRRLSAGEALFHQGDPGASMFILVNGRLRIIVKGTKGSEHIVGEIGRGECVGEFALLTPEERSATVYAVRDSDVVELSSDMFESLVQDSPQTMLSIMRSIAQRLQRANLALREKKARGSTLRLCRFITPSPWPTFQIGWQSG